jgi:SsrA-binding protein
MKVTNRNVGFEYEILERIECGVELTGGEAKSARAGKIKLEGAYVKILEGEAKLINCHIFPYEYSGSEEGSDRTRKLLLHKGEIISLEQKIKSQRLTLVPTAMYSRGPRVKVEIGLARGKKKYEKKERVQERDINRDRMRESRGKAN